MSCVNEQDAIVVGLKNILSKQGKDIFYDTRKAKAILSDYFPSIIDAEKRLLNIAIESGVCKMILGMSYGDEQYIYEKAKNALINDNYISETAATMTVDRFFLAAGKRIPEKKSNYTTVVTQVKQTEPDTSSVVDEYIASIKEAVNNWQGLMERFTRLAEQPLTETQRLSIVRLLGEMTDLQEQIDKLQLDANTNLTVEQVKKLLAIIPKIKDFIKEVDEIESDIYNNLPTTKTLIVASWQICQPNVIFYLNSMLGNVAYTTKACLDYKGREYVIANLNMTAFNFVFVVHNSQLVLEADVGVCNYLIDFCKKKGFII